MRPHFASTIDSVTGRILDKAIVDLGTWTQNTSYASDMKGYIALSRVRTAHDLLLTDMWPPTMLAGGAHPWPPDL
eukprot:6183149-Karenia_brevis.AAC.1